MSRKAMYLTDADLQASFKSYLLEGDTDFIFNGTSKTFNDFLTLGQQNKHLVRRKYMDDVEVENTNNWYVDVDALHRMNLLPI